MVLELKPPHSEFFSSLMPLRSTLLSYILSFAYLGIYWNNHHHMFHLVEKVTGPILWCNHILLFFLSLVPFTTAWMGENHFAPTPVFLYGLNLLAAAFAYWALQQAIIRAQGPQSILRRAIGVDTKSRISQGLYLVGVGSALFLPWLACFLYAAVAVIWIIPDRRIESVEC